MDERSTYDDDFYGWSQQQAGVLRRLADRSDLPNDLDLEHVIDEIEGVGDNALHSVQSYLRLIFVHLMKLASNPQADARSHWLAEIIGFQAELVSRYSRSMRQQIDLDLLWRRARVQAEATLAVYGETLVPLPERCPFALDDFLSDEIDPAGLLQVLLSRCGHAP